MSEIYIDGKKLYYEEYGDRSNPCLMILHGGPGASCIDFTRPAEWLSDRLYVILLDQFGCGRSGYFEEGSDEKFGMPEHLEQIEKFREYLGIEKWNILGQSYGGMLAALYANRYPESIEKVIYECPSWNFVESSKSITKYFCDRFLKKNNLTEALTIADEIMNADYTGREMDSMLDILKIQPYITDMATLFYLHGTTVEDCLADYAALGLDEREMDKAAETHMMKIAEEGSMFMDFLPLITENIQPSLLIEGCYDPACTMYQRFYYIDNARDGRIINLDNCGHWPHLECKDEYQKAVKDFLLG